METTRSGPLNPPPPPTPNSNELSGTAKTIIGLIVIIVLAVTIGLLIYFLSPSSTSINKLTRTVGNYTLVYNVSSNSDHTGILSIGSAEFELKLSANVLIRFTEDNVGNVYIKKGDTEYTVNPNSNILDMKEFTGMPDSGVTNDNIKTVIPEDVDVSSFKNYFMPTEFDGTLSDSLKLYILEDFLIILDGNEPPSSDSSLGSTSSTSGTPACTYPSVLINGECKDVSGVRCRMNSNKIQVSLDDVNWVVPSATINSNSIYLDNNSLTHVIAYDDEQKLNCVPVCIDGYIYDNDKGECELDTPAVSELCTLIEYINYQSARNEPIDPDITALLAPGADNTDGMYRIKKTNINPTSPTIFDCELDMCQSATDHDPPDGKVCVDPDMSIESPLGYIRNVEGCCIRRS